MTTNISKVRKELARIFAIIIAVEKHNDPFIHEPLSKKKTVLKMILRYALYNLLVTALDMLYSP
jgi:hypothetical protein